MRTKKATKNFIISTVLTLTIALIGIAKSKMFLVYLGDELTGIYQLFSQIFSYISMVDAGLTGSLLFYLYKPISIDDKDEVNSLLSGGRYFFNVIAIIMLVVGILISFKLGFFIKDTTYSLNYIQICFVIFIFSSILNYFVTTRKLLFEAQQEVYKVHLIVYISMIVKALIEIVFVVLGLKLLSLMALFTITSLLQNLFILIFSKKEHKDLTYVKKKNFVFLKETKNLIIQRIGGIIFNNIDIILISKFIGPVSIVIYTSYNYIINSLLTVFKKIGSSSLAGIGNLLVTEEEKTKKIFYEYNSMCFFIANTIAVPLLFSISPFVGLFYGSKYVLPVLGAVCVVVILYLEIIKIALDTFINALGYFSKIKVCIILQSGTNLVLSIILLNYLGISGILLATIISYLLGEFIYYPIILNNNYFKNNKIHYYSKSFKMLLPFIINVCLIYLCVNKIVIPNLLMWFIYGASIFVVNLILVTIYFKLTKELTFMNRFIKLLKKGVKSNE